MQYTLFTLAAVFAAAATAQSVPDCAAPCVAGQLPKQCAAQDIGCICGDTTFITNVSCCVFKSCPASDQAAALTFARQICGVGGVSLTVTGATCLSTGAGSSSTAAPASSTSAGSDSASTTSGASAMSTGGTSGATSSNIAPVTTAGGSSAVSTAAGAKATAMAGFVGAAVAAVALL